MKKCIAIFGLLASLALAFPVFAICGGTVVYDNDCDSNSLPYTDSCCPQGYRVQGVVYNDLIGQDNTDAVGAACRSVSNGNIMIASSATGPVAQVPETPIQTQTSGL